MYTNGINRYLSVCSFTAHLSGKSPPLGDHQAPRGQWRRDAEPEEREPALGEDRPGEESPYLETYHGDDGQQRVLQGVLQDDRAPIQSFCPRCADVVLVQHPAHLVAKRPIRRDRRGDGDDAVAGQHLRHPADAADVGVAVLFGEAEPFREVCADHIAVKDGDFALELQIFERLIGISGIGPKLALAVLSGSSDRARS